MVQADASTTEAPEKVTRTPEQWSDSEIVAAVRNGTHILVPRGGDFEVGDFDLDSWENLEGSRGLMIALSREQCRFVAPQMYFRPHDLFAGQVNFSSEPESDAVSLNQTSLNPSE